MEKKTIPVAEAIAKGYTHYGEPGGEYVGRIDNMRPDQVESGKFAVADEPYPYQIQDDLIFNLIAEYLEEQDEVYSDNVDLSMLIAEADVDFTAITKAVNDALSSKVFYPLTDLFIVP